MPFFRCHNMKWMHSKGDLAPVDIPVKCEVSELQRSIAKAAVDFHDLDNDGRISGQREMAVGLQDGSWIESKGMYGEI